MSFATDPRGVLLEPALALRALCADERAHLMSNDAGLAAQGICLASATSVASVR